LFSPALLKIQPAAASAMELASSLVHTASGLRPMLTSLPQEHGDLQQGHVFCKHYSITFAKLACLDFDNPTY
jgi:hypothetical protein